MSTRAVIDDVAVQQLAEVMAGDVVTPDHPEYDQARAVWNGMVDRYPALIARCHAVADFARANAVTVSVRGGGHSVVGYSTCDDGLVIDLSPMKGIKVDPEAKTAQAQAGLTWGEFDAATQEHGLAVTGGRFSTTGISGLALNSGSGWLDRKCGLTGDNLLEAEVVTADGRVIKASPTENEDLFWGLRGGGGNFGIVTSLEYRLHPVGPQVIAGGVVHDFADAPEVLRFFADFAATAPDELSMIASTFRAPPGFPVAPELHGELVTVLAVCYAGDLAMGERALRPLRAFGRPLADLVAPMPYTALQSRSDAAYPSGQRNYWKSHFVGEIADDAIAKVVEHAPRMTSPLSSFYFQRLGGAIGRAGADTAAFSHREAAFDFTILTVWEDPAEDGEHIAWARGLFGAMAPHANGVYVNNLGTEGAERVRAAYVPATYERLVALKDAYDPDNVFHLNQNVAPSA